MGDCFPLPGMFGAITSGEDAALDRDEGIVVVAEDEAIKSANASAEPHFSWGVEKGQYEPLQPAPRVAVYHRYGLRVGNRYMVGLYSDQRPIFLVGIVNSLVPPPTSALIEKPQITEGGELGARYISNGVIPNIWQQIVNDRK